MEILFADDHNLIREALSPVLKRLAETVTIHEAGSLDDAIASYKGQRAPDLILLDLLMPGMEGLRGIARVKKRFPTAPVVILSGFYDKRTVLSAIEQGASGFIPKTNTGETLLNALRLVLAGEKYLPSSLLSAEPLPALSAAATVGRSIPSGSVLAKLTARELEILSQLIDGRSNKEIARSLGLQEITAKVHLSNAYRKIGASSRADAVRIAFRHGWN